MAAMESANPSKLDDKSSTASSASGSTPSLDAVSQGKAKGVAKDGVKDGNTTISRKLNLKKSFRMISSQMKADKGQDKNEPSRFLGEGVSFKAKLIGILEVSEARGDRMCQEALADLKMAIRAAGEHKQRITINIAIDGLRLRDEKNGDCLYHHPVHKISFIAQDMSDSRAFGYIFGSPDTGHRFFGIKTDKAASQVVIAMRDLFQVVFELKKKEIEMAKQHIEQNQIKIGSGMFMDSSSSSKNGIGNSDQATVKRTIREETIKENGNSSVSAKSTHKTSEVIADLLDLEFELNSIQQGIHQMDRITPSDPFGPSSTKESFNSDPFGDSFSPPTAIPPPPKAVKTSVSLLPPPHTLKEPTPTRVSDPFNVPPPSRQPHRRGGVRGRSVAAEKFNTAVAEVNKAVESVPALPQQEKHWFDQETESLFGDSEMTSPAFISNTNTSTFSNLTEPVNDMSRSSPSQQIGLFDVFTELDPLGTGRSRPYIDRKDFFQDLKNPPKKVLKDLVTEAPLEATAPLFQATFDTASNRHSGTSDMHDPNTSIGSNSSLTNMEIASFPTSSVHPDPFNEVDPFYHSDPFEDAPIGRADGFPPVNGSADPFKVTFADFSKFGSDQRTEFSSLEDSFPPHETLAKRLSSSPLPDANQSVFSPRTNFHGPLRVSLPPEKSGGAAQEEAALFNTSSRQSAPRPSSSTVKPRTKSRLHKQTTLSGLPKLPSPKSSQRSNRLAKQITVDGCGTKPQSLHPSPTPATPPTPHRYDRRSPASHLENVNLRNRCAITPSPPVVACFPDVDENGSRFSGSSAEFSEIAPEPPPRPGFNVAFIKPPPLPPKRQQAGQILRPPPRPPHTDEQAHYDYIENYETSASPTPQQESEELKSPPIPVPARRPRFSLDDVGTAPQRPRRHHPVASTLSNKSSEDDYLTPTPFPLIPPPQKRSQDASKSGVSMSGPAVPSALAPLHIPNEAETKQIQATSLNLTLSQLTKTGFTDLAVALGISPSELSNMTLQELTVCLAKLSEDAKPKPAVDENEKAIEPNKREPGILRTFQLSADARAKFDKYFEETDKKKEPEDAFQETLFDKYAVFRELINEEKTEEQPNEIQEVDDVEINADAETDVFEECNFEDDVVADIDTVAAARTDDAGDRYAALREISIDEGDSGALSDKEDSIAEIAVIEEEDDLLTLSRQHSSESPTMETATMRGEQLSIIETTIYEEDVSTLEADNDEAMEDVPDIIEEEVEEECIEDQVVEEPILTIESKEVVNPIQAPLASEAFDLSPSPEEEEAKSFHVETPVKDVPVPAADSWAKFETAEIPASEGVSEEASPWSSDSKEFAKVASPAWQEHFDEGHDRGRRGRIQRTSPWQEEESEEGNNERRQADGSWRENGWSEGESFYEDVHSRRERGYHEDRHGRRRRVSPWKKGQRSSRDVSPWEHGRYPDRSLDDEEDDEEYEKYWKTRPKNRGSSWDDERRRRFGSREINNGLDYEEGRKRRPSPWSGEADRRNSRESVNWEDEERFSQRDFVDRRPRDRDREEDYRRRRELESDPRYAWSRKGVPESDYGRREPARRSQEGSRRYYRDRSRESPWEDEYSEQGDDDSPQYHNPKRNWQSKRPNSASDARRTSDKSPGEFKNRLSDKPQYSLPAMRSERESGEKMSIAERRYRDKGGVRPASREGHFNTSDQEYDYWPQERPRRESGGYEKRSQTLHTRRPNKFKKSQDRTYGQKSPFDDDFSSHPLSVSNSDIVKSQDSDTSEHFRKKSPINPAGLFTYTDAFPRRRDQYVEDIRTNEMVPSSPLDPRDSPLEEPGRTRTSRGSCNRQSPFEDDFTPPDTRPNSGRRISSVSSDISDRRSPYEEVRAGRRVPSVAEEKEFDGEFKNGRSNDDVFLPGDAPEANADQSFADFDNGAFTNSSVGEVVTKKPTAESRRTERRILREENRKSDKVFANKARMPSNRADPLNIKKSESVNIFTREKDPFDDDDFFKSEAPSSSTRPRPDQPQHSVRSSEKAASSNNGDPFKWTRAFDSFNFDEEN